MTWSNPIFSIKEYDRVSKKIWKFIRLVYQREEVKFVEFLILNGGRENEGIFDITGNTVTGFLCQQIEEMVKIQRN